MADLKDSLTTKIGPLPIAVWVGVPFGGYIVYRWWKHKTGGSAPEVEPIATSADYVGDADDFTNGYGNAAGGYGSSTSTNTYTPPAIQDNEDWGREAINWLIAKGFTPTQAAQAINAYLYGTTDTLNSQLMAMLNEALKQFGTPPEPVTTIPTLTPTPVDEVTTPEGPVQGTPNPTLYNFTIISKPVTPSVQDPEYQMVLEQGYGVTKTVIEAKQKYVNDYNAQNGHSRLTITVTPA